MRQIHEQSGDNSELNKSLRSSSFAEIEESDSSDSGFSAYTMNE